MTLNTDHPMNDTPFEDLDEQLAAAAAAAAPLGDLLPGHRARLLTSTAEALDQAAAQLVPQAVRETHLPEQRLTAELARTTYQLRSFANALAEGSWVDAIIDTADPEHPLGPRPDVRRMLIPLGPVLVWAASNFPFAFSVAGGDTASALAAGCPVVVKAHPGHPVLSELTAAIMRDVLPEGALALIHGVASGRAALIDDRIRASAFTGSVAVGRELFDLANARPQPIPFYGELGSLNPVFVTPGAVAARGEQIAAGFVASFTLGTGQFCTKPGLLFLPSGHGLLGHLAAAVRAVSPAPMLHDRIREGHCRVLARLAGTSGIRTVVEPAHHEDGLVSGSLLATTVAELLADPTAILEECFGPTSVVVEYDDVPQLCAAAEAFGGQLTATVHAEPADAELAIPLLRRLRDRAGRLVYNGWPTGVAVTEAMHHGGPYPATTAPLHTAVGATAIRRFLRPVCYQNAPEHLLPPELRDRNELGIPRRVNGQLTTEPVHPQETP